MIEMEPKELPQAGDPIQLGQFRGIILEVSEYRVMKSLENGKNIYSPYGYWQGNSFIKCPYLKIRLDVTKRYQAKDTFVRPPSRKIKKAVEGGYNYIEHYVFCDEVTYLEPNQ